MSRKANSEVEVVPLQFDPAPDVEAIGNDLIARYHPHLAGCRIAYLFRNKRKVKGGKEVYATAEKCSAKTKALVACAQAESSGEEPFVFCIVVSYEVWRDLSGTQRTALIDHELSHCYVDEDEKTGEITYSIRAHDIEEFTNVARRWGAQSHDLVLFKSALNGEDEEPKKPVEEVKANASQGEPIAEVVDARSHWHIGKDAANKPKTKTKQIVVRESA